MKTKGEDCILGAGVTGLAAAATSGLAAYEGEAQPGGTCASYYVRPGDSGRLAALPEDGEAYRFEIGGGHWIFGGSPLIRRFLRRTVAMKCYQRRAGVYFPERKLSVPYPLQNHLGFLGHDLAAQVLQEILNAPQGRPSTMAGWLEQCFGPTLLELFFGPFHQLYTAGLWTRIAPQDAYKSPVDPTLAVRGAFGPTPAVGYNVSFLYPERGLNALASAMVRQGRIQSGRRVAHVNVHRKQIEFEDGSGTSYDLLLSTFPLNRMLRLTGLEINEEADPSTSVLVLNVGAVRGPECPEAHWLYVPHSRSGFYRVGFYSNVEPSFLPRSSAGRVSMYIERAYREGHKPSGEEIQDYAKAAVEELREWNFIRETEVVSPTWIDVAYTWTLPGSRWRKSALKTLEENDILMTGRYGKWEFQGIADSIQDGFIAGAALRGSSRPLPEWD